ncbi:ribosomal protein L21-like protein [Plectosphaerella cucumerina]|uniref:Large ribosomal subunit protein bL21m n=1 Tax=Plectosphaerella cucumerina TaxID=40658 RepID=A0A8K0TFW7_9PEZI|nr:ribosomal protein L21-like protein [Plectosphaerella cucumerina]
MSRSLLRSILELRAPAARPVCLSPVALLPLQARRSFNSTPPIVEPAPTPDAAAATIPPTPSKKPIEAIYPPQPSTPKTISQSVRDLLPLLAAQPSHYITVHIHGRPYLVQPGDHVRLPFRMPGVVPGDVLRLDRASVLGSRDFTLKGAPYIDDRLFECRAVVTGSELEPVRLTVKKKQRTRRKQTIRSQHRFTTLAISELKIKEVEDIE